MSDAIVLNLINKQILQFFALLVFLLFPARYSAQFIQDTSKKIQYLAVPVFFKTPEYGFAYGLSGSMSFNTSHKRDSLTRTSFIQVIGLNTTRKVNSEAIDATIYFPKEKYVLLSTISHNYFPDKFWGIGPKSPDLKVPEKYIYEHLYGLAHVKRRVSNRVFVGLLYEFQNVYRLLYPDSGIFA
ncbi:MAG: hypothetical protein IT236_08630, partial [Bacteroidia bacterium]|nr:hypothetical protein [Bacteroidia bacterium]